MLLSAEYSRFLAHVAIHHFEGIRVFFRTNLFQTLTKHLVFMFGKALDVWEITVLKKWFYWYTLVWSNFIISIQRLILAMKIITPQFSKFGIA